MADTWHIDYSAAQLDGRTIAQTKVGPQGEYATGAIRYIDDISNSRLVRTKHITKAEYASLKAAGIAMDAMYMEVGVDDPLGGYAQGQAYARRAQAGADYLGWRGKILFCCDRWFNSSGRTPISVKIWQDYLDGAVSILGRSIVGGYGFADAIDAARGHVDFAVQCGARSAVRSWVSGWQDNNVQPKVGGISADRVLILNPFNAPGGGGSTPPTPTPGGSGKVPFAHLEEYLMNPIVHDPTPNGGVQDGFLVHTGAAAVLVVQPLDKDKMCFFGAGDATKGVAPVWCYGPGGGKGGGHSAIPVTKDTYDMGNERRLTRNNPGLYEIPAGTTSVFYSYSSNGRTSVQIVPKYLLG
jgi:hypothetical protein